jgi:ferredoxin
MYLAAAAKTKWENSSIFSEMRQISLRSSLAHAMLNQNRRRMPSAMGTVAPMRRDKETAVSQHNSWVLPIVNTARCTGCGECERSCPTRAVIVRQKLAMITRPEACTFCEICEARCPSGAIGRPFTIMFENSSNAEQ